jgi:hypothetical protein
MAERILDVEPNASLSDVKRAYYLKIKGLDESNDNFKESFDEYTDAYNKLVTSRTSNKTDTGYLHRESIIPFSSFFADPFANSFFSMRPYNAFSHLHNRVSALMDHFHNDTSHSLDTDIDKDLEAAVEEPTTDPNSYCKYVSSYTTYNNGKKFSKTTSRVERVKDGKKRVSHITKTQDGDKITVDRHGRKSLE